jgi:pyrimidine operon attenuation protein/uracil phosphoribosyltransferase
MKILNHHQIEQKIKRLAIEILENNYEEEQIILAGINNNGLNFAVQLKDQLDSISQLKVVLTRIRLDPADPLSSPIQCELDKEALEGEVVIIVDDVANTGRTIFYATKPLLEVLPKRVEVAVLVDRKHKSFPILVDYVGLSLATTLKENINVQIQEGAEPAVFLN